MNGPPIYIILKTRGDGYGHNSQEFIAWYFDKEEAEQRRAALKADAPSEFTWYEVEEVPAGSPMPERSRW